MKLLIVNNHSRYINDLEKILSNHDTKTTHFNNLSEDKTKDIDAVILSGGNKYSVIDNNEKYSKEIEMIKNIEIPILGICLGFQLICYSYGEKIEMMNRKIIGKKEITKINEDNIFNGLNQLFVYKHHIFSVNYVKNLIPLAVSEECVEAIKHPFKPIYGVQFHPEITRKGLNGYKIINNFLDSIK